MSQPVFHIALLCCTAVNATSLMWLAGQHYLGGGDRTATGPHVVTPGDSAVETDLSFASGAPTPTAAEGRALPEGEDPGLSEAPLPVGGPRKPKPKPEPKRAPATGQRGTASASVGNPVAAEGRQPATSDRIFSLTDAPPMRKRALVKPSRAQRKTSDIQDPWAETQPRPRARPPTSAGVHNPF